MRKYSCNKWLVNKRTINEKKTKIGRIMLRLVEEVCKMSICRGNVIGEEKYD